MKTTIPPAPAKIKRREISAIRTFPPGCIRLSVSIPAVQIPPPKIEPLPNHQEEESKESHGSTPPEIESKEDFKLEASGELLVGLDGPGFLEASKMFGVPKRRKLSAVRAFPVGVERKLRRTWEASVMAASSESKVGLVIAKEEDEVERGNIVIEAAGESSVGRGGIGIAANVKRKGVEEEGVDEVGRGNIVIAAVAAESSTGKKQAMRGEFGSGNVGVAAFESPVNDVQNKCIEEGGERDEVGRDYIGTEPVVESSVKDINLFQGRNVRDLRGKATLDDDDDDTGNIDVGEEDYFEDEVLEPVPIREREVEDFGDELRFKSAKPRDLEVSECIGTLKRKFNEDAYRERSTMPKPTVKDKFTPKSDGPRKMVVAKKSIPNVLPKLKTIPIGPQNPKSIPSGHPKLQQIQSGSSKPNQHVGGSSGATPREMVKRALRLFQKLVDNDETKKGANGRTDTTAATILKKNNNWVNNGASIVGDVPGVLAGDVFHYRVELAIVGLHRLYQAGIDYMKRSDGKIIATSIVASGGYPDDLERSGELIYSGSGGNGDPKKNKGPEDQKLERGNLALKNSVYFKTPVRVIYGSKEQNKSVSSSGKAKTTMNFTYDGLYLVVECWSEKGPKGFLVYKYRLRRLPRAENAERNSDSDRE